MREDLYFPIQVCPAQKIFFSSTPTLIELTDTYYVLLSEVDIDKEISAGTA
jgi:hypothetical protein